MNEWKADLKETVTPLLQKVLDGLVDLRTMNEFAGNRVKESIRDHLIRLSGSRHATANRLGGTPTGFLGNAAEQVTVEPDDFGVTVGVASPAVTRAFSDVTIRAGTQSPGVKYLTIPICGAAYGMRINKGMKARFKGGFFFRSKKGNLLYGMKLPDKTILLLYALKEQITQKQDRSLMPSDQELNTEALAGIADYLGTLVNKAEVKNVD
jgi:hypothetical protein